MTLGRMMVKKGGDTEISYEKKNAASPGRVKSGKKNAGYR